MVSWNTDETLRSRNSRRSRNTPKSNLASMGIYIFNWKLLRKLLTADMKDPESSHDFGKDIIPELLNDGKRLFAYRFKGYWKDVGTIDSLWEANMDLLDKNNELDLSDPSWKIYTEDTNTLPHYIGPDAVIRKRLSHRDVSSAEKSEIPSCSPARKSVRAPRSLTVF